MFSLWISQATTGASSAGSARASLGAGLVCFRRYAIFREVLSIVLTTCLLQEELAQVKKFFSRVIKNIFSIFFNNILCFVLHVLAFALLECSPVLAAPVLSAKGNAFCLSGEPFIKPIALFTLGDLICLQVRILLLLCDSCLDKSFPRQ